jgi:long-chain acyl-CoA synthetase
VLTRKDALARLTAPGEPFEICEIDAIGRRIRAFKNAPPTLRDLFAASRSDKTFLVFDDERLTFEQTWRRACMLGHALVHEFGVRPGDRVAISMRNYPEWVIGFIAVTSIGAVAVAMNALWQPAELEFGLSDSEAVVLLADQERLERLAQCRAPANLQVIAVRSGTPPPGAIDFETVMSRTETQAMPDRAPGPDDDATMFYTSGSTGNPKGVVSTHRAIISALLSWELDAKAGVMTGLIPEPQPDAPQPVALLGIPLFHVTGSHAMFLSSVRPQRRLVLMYKWDAERAAELIEREHVTHFTAPAAVTGDLVELAARTKRDLSSLTVVGGGGASRAPAQVRAIGRAFGKAVPSTGWGMTETNAIGVGIGYRDYLDHPESSGRCSAVLDIRIVDEAGRDLPTGQRGELQVRGASLMRGYWKRPDANAEAFDGDWFRTGDVAYLDADGFLYIVDRIKDLVIRGGENIGCGTVEAALLEHPAVAEACVYGVPDDRLGEEVAATVFTRRTVDEAELKAFLAERIAKFQVPRYFTFADAPLPRGPTGKIFKRQLRAEAVDRLRA